MTTQFDIWTLGQHYITAPAHTFSAAVEQEIRDFCNYAWRVEIEQRGVEVVFVDFQPYRSAKEMRDRVRAEGVLYISTEGNVTETDNHPYAVWPVLNLQHRAIHDSHHVALNAGFNAPGEITASAHMVKLARDWGFSETVQQFLFSDMVGQTGHFYATGGDYSDQKVVLFDMDIINELVRLYEHAPAPLGGVLSKDYHRGLTLSGGRRVFGDIGGGAAVFAAEGQALQQPQRDEDDRRRHADLRVGRQHADHRGRQAHDEDGDEEGVFSADDIAELVHPETLEVRAEGLDLVRGKLGGADGGEAENSNDRRKRVDAHGDARRMKRERGSV